MVRNNGESPFDPEERKELRRVVPHVPTLLEMAESRQFWKRVYVTLKRTIILLAATVTGLGAMAGAVIAIKEFLKRIAS